MTTPIKAKHDTGTATFRPDIQALRAFAVLVVVIFHLWPHRLTGGFVGVDIFFAISGFLITRHLMKELDATGRISLAYFWAKRARRLLPASLFVLAVSAISTIAFVPQMYWQSFMKQIGASAIYAQNWFLASDSVQYFSSEDAASPVKHFWSLSVEEQFYLAWPLIIIGTLLFTRKLGVAGRRRGVLIALIAVAAASLTASIHLTIVSPGEAYFVTHARAWEFAAGGILAILGTSAANPNHVSRVIVSWAGWLTAIGAVIMFSSATQFPGYMALIPVLGTLAIIWAGSPSSPFAPSRYLAAAPIQALGNLSYSVYLWHWPLIIIATISVDDFHWRAKLLLIPVILILAWTTTRYVETPIRTGKMLTGRRPRATFIATLIVMAVIAVPAFAVSSHMAKVGADETIRAAAAASSSGPCFGAGSLDAALDCADVVYETLTPSAAAAKDDLPEVYANGCYTDLESSDLNSCVVGEEGAEFRVALIGDSHAAHWYPAVKKIAEDRGWELTPFMKSACPQSSAVKLDDVDAVAASCAAWNEKLAAELSAAASYDLVIVSHSATGDAYESKGAAITGFQDAWRQFTDRGSKVVVIRDVPQANAGTTLCVAKHETDSDVCNLPASKSHVDDLMVDAAAGQKNVSVADMTSSFCTTGGCKVVVGGVVVYRDTHHITATYASTLAPMLQERLASLGVDVD